MIVTDSISYYEPFVKWFMPENRLDIQKAWDFAIVGVYRLVINFFFIFEIYNSRY
jgi:hypothetical protein